MATYRDIPRHIFISPATLELMPSCSIKYGLVLS